MDANGMKRLLDDAVSTAKAHDYITSLAITVDAEIGYASLDIEEKDGTSLSFSEYFKAER